MRRAAAQNTSAAMKEDSFYVSAEEDTKEDRTYHVWMHKCPKSANCSQSFINKVRPKLKTFKGVEKLKEGLAQHLLYSTSHGDVTTHEKAMAIVNEYCQSRPNAIKEVTETFSDREDMRKWYAEAQKAASKVPTPPKDPPPGIEKVAAKGKSSREITDPLAIVAPIKEELDRGEVPTLIVPDDDEDGDVGVVANAKDRALDPKRKQRMGDAENATQNAIAAKKPKTAPAIPPGMPHLGCGHATTSKAPQAGRFAKQHQQRQAEKAAPAAPSNDPVPFTIHDAEALAQSASRIETVGNQIVRACDSLINVLPTLKKQIEAETSFAKGQAQKFKDLWKFAQDSVVT